jgi:hypothetical protein
LAFTDEELQAAQAEGLGLRGMAAKFGCDRDVIRRRLRLLESGEAPQSVIRPVVQRPRISEVIDLDPAPFAVPIPRPAKLTPGTPLRSVVYGDVHFPHQDQAALEILYAVIKDVRPDIIVNLGDTADCYTISAYDKDPQNIHGLQDEIDLVRAHLHQVAQLAPQAQRYYLEGNHEDRLRRLIWTLPGTASELARLRAFQQAMTWPNLLDLDEIGWTWVESAGQTHHKILPRIITKHGDIVRRWSGMSAKGEWERYGQSGISGHVHRMGRFYTSDRNGAHTWVEAGCLCDTDPRYTRDPNWQNGLVVVEHSADRQRFEMHLVYVQDGRALWRGQDYRAAAA